MKPVRLATLGLSGCSGCLMSLLDVDGWLAEVATRAEFVHGALVDAKTWPADIDVCLVEGAVGSEGDLAQLQSARRASRLLVACGDCAVTGNVPALRNAWPAGSVRAGRPDNGLPAALLPRVRPLHAYVTVDHFLPGCPVSPEQYRHLLGPLFGLPDSTAPRARFG
jgi:NAD-reducing hydrogenase small subunit